MIDLSDSNSVLQQHLLSDDELQEAGSLSYNIIRTVACGRYTARFLVNGEVWSFDLATTASGKKEFTVSGVEHSLLGSNLLRFVFHRAAEAMLATRLGHEEWAEKQRAKTRSKQAA